MKFINQIEPFIGAKEAEAAHKYLSSGGWLTEFSETEKFAESISQFLGVKYAVLTTSGTIGLYLALISLGLKRGDKVLVPNFTMVATVNVIKWAGFEPVLVDIDPKNLCAKFDDIKITSNIRALIYVHINGRCGDIKKIVEFCKTHNLFFIEDAAQAFGSIWENKYLGTLSDVGVYSLSPHKIITTGQGGVIVTNNPKIFYKIKKLKDFYRTKPGVDIHEGIGFNFKFTDLQAVVGNEQMKSIKVRIKKKKEIFARYQKNLKEVQFLTTDLSQTLPWFVDIILPTRKIRDSLIPFLKEKGIGTRPFYPPISDQIPYRKYAKQEFKNSRDLSYRGLWLPSSLNLNNEKIDLICEKIKKGLIRKSDT
jgi:perosamine synthetase